MTVIKDKIFTDEPVEIDDTQFFRCEFIRCTLVYSGGGAPGFERCKFDTPQFEFSGPAGRTLAFMQGLYNTPFRDSIEKTFENIKLSRPQERIHRNG